MKSWKQLKAQARKAFSYDVSEGRVHEKKEKVFIDGFMSGHLFATDEMIYELRKNEMEADKKWEKKKNEI